MRQRRARWESFTYTGRFRYFLTFCTHARRSVFTDAAIVDCVWQEIRRTAEHEGFAVLARVFMPDHLHLLVQGRSDTADLRRFVARAKQRSGYVFAQSTRSRLWQPSYYDHVLRDDESELPFIRYIIENPVRAGLTSNPEEYPYLDTGDIAIVDMVKLLTSAGIDVWSSSRARQPPHDTVVTRQA